MPSTIDERVVRMRFDNAQFENGVKGTMTLLDQFENKLKFEGASKGIQEIEKASSKIDLSPMAKAADVIEVKFSAMSIAAITAIENIVNKAVDAGLRISKSLTLDQVTAGFDKYTEKTAAVQTIMNATGKAVEDVNSALDKLQWFSDETSYNFVDMTSNVGKFTSAGIDLDIAVSAMQGIALAAADAGANSNEASRAMYNFSQALSKGFVQLIDWKSIENANMATISFKDTLIDAALAVGTIEKVGDNAYRSLTTNAKGKTSDIFNATKDFNDSLQFQWLSNEALLEGLSRYSAYADKIYEVSDAFDTCADAMAATSAEGMELGERAFKAGQQAKTFREAIDATKDAVSSGWMRTFEILIGNFNESVEVWTAFTNTLWDVFASGGESRNELLKSGLMSGWDQLMEEGIKDADLFRDAVIRVGKETYDAATDTVTLLDHFNKQTKLNAFDEMLSSSKAFDESLTEGWVTADVLAKAIDNISTEINTLSDEELKNKGYTDASIQSFIDLKNKVDDGSISLEEFARLMSRKSGRENIIQGIANSFNALMSFIEPLKEAFANIFPAPTAEQIYNFTVKFAEFTDKLKLSEGAMEGLRKTTEVLLKPLRLIFDILKIGIGLLGKFVLAVHDVIDTGLNWINNLSDIEGVLRKVFGNKRYASLAESWATITTKVSAGFQKLKTAIIDAFGIKGRDNIIARVTDSIEEFKEKASGVKESILDGIVYGLQKISEIDVDGAVNSIIDSFTWLSDTVDKIKDDLVKYFNIVKDYFVNAFNDIDLSSAENLGKQLKSVGENIYQFFKTFSFKNAFDDFVESHPQIVNALIKIKDGVVDFVKELTPSKIIIIAFATALLSILVATGKFITAVSETINAIATLANNISTTITAFRNSLNSMSRALDATMILSIAGALAIVSGALVQLSYVPADKLWSSAAVLGALAAGLVVLIGVMALVAKVIGKSKDFQKGFLSAIIGVTAIAGSLAVLAIALKQLSGTNVISNIENSIIIAGLMVSLAMVFKMLASDKKAIVGVQTALSMAIGIEVLVLALKQLSGMQPEEILHGLIGLQVIMLALFELAVTSRVMAKSSTLSAVIGMVVELMIVVAYLDKLANKDMETILKGVVMFQPIFLAMMELAIVSRVIAKKNAFSSLIGMAVMLVSMRIVIEDLGKMDESVLNQGLKYVLLLSGIMEGLIFLMKTVDDDKRVVKGAGTTLMAMSLAMVFLTLVIDYLGHLDPDVAMQGVTAISALGLVMAAILAASKDSKKATGPIIALGVVLALAVGSIVILSLIDWKTVLSSAIAMDSVMLSLAIVMKSIHSIKVGDAATIIGLLGLVLTEVVAALAILATVKNVDSLITSAEAISLCLIAVSVAFRILDGGEINDRNLKRLIPTAIALGAFLLELVGGLSALSAIGADWSTMISSAAALSLVILAVSEAMNIMTKSKIGDSKTTRLIASAKAMAVFIIEISIALGVLSNYGGNWSSMITSAGALSLTLVALAEAINIMNKSDLSKIDPSQLTKISGAMAIFLVEIGVVIGLLSNFGGSWSSMIASAVALGITINALAIAINILDNAKMGNAGKLATTAVAMGIVITEIVAALIALTAFNAENVISNAIALGVAINAIALATNLMNGMKLSEGAGVALAITGIILPLTAALKVMGDMDPTANLANITSLTLAIGALGALVYAFDKLNADTGTIGNAAAGAAAIDVVILIIGFLATLVGAIMKDSTTLDAGVEQIRKLEPLAGMFAVISYVLGVMAKFNLKAKPLISAAAGIGAGFDIIVGAVGALAYVLGLLVNNFPNIETNLDKGGEILTKIGRFIGDTLGSVIGGFAEGVGEGIANSLTTIGDGLKSFGESFAPVVETFSSEAASTAATNIDNLAGALLKITTGDFLSTLLGQSESLAQFGEELNEFAPGFKEFLTSFGDVDIDAAKIQAVTSAAGALADFAKNLTKHGGIWQHIVGETEGVTDFVNDLNGSGNAENGLAKGLVNFHETIKNTDFQDGKIEAAATAAGALADFAKGLDKHGGIWQHLVGETEGVTDFVNDLNGNGNPDNGLAKGLVTFHDTVKGTKLDDGKIDAAVKAATALSDFANGLVQHNGIWQDIVGETESISQFVHDLNGNGNPEEGLAQGLVDFSDIISNGNFDETSVGLAVNAAKLIAGFAQGLGSAKTSIDEFFTGKTITLTQFGNDLSGFSSSYAVFLKNVVVEDSNKLTSAVLNLEKVFGLVKDIGSYEPGTITDWNTALESIAGDGLSAFVATFAKEDAHKQYDIAANTIMSRFCAKLYSTSQVMIPPSITILVNEMCKDMIEQLDRFTGIGQTIAETITAEVNSISFDVGGIGTELVSQFGSSFSKMAPEVETATREAFQKVIPTIKNSLGMNSSPGTPKRIGTELVQKIIEGMESKLVEATNKGTNLGSSIVGSIKGVAILQKADLMTTFESVGESAITSLNAGILNNSSKPIESALACCDQIKEAVDKAFAETTFEISLVNFNIQDLDSEITTNFIEPLLNMRPDIEEAVTKAFEPIIPALKTSIGADTDPTSSYLIGYDLMNEFMIGINNMAPIVITTSTNTGRAIMKAFNDVAIEQKPILAATYSSVGVNSVMSLANAVRSTTPYVITEISIMCTDMLATMQEILSVEAFTELGMTVGLGFASGMRDSIGDVRKAAGDIVGATIDEIKYRLDSHSPSRVTRKIGNNTGSGFALGLYDSASMVESSAVDIAELAIKSCSNAVSAVTDNLDVTNSNYLSNAISNAIDQAIATLNSSPSMQPVIRPVLDLSEVEQDLRGFNFGSVGFHAARVEHQFAIAKAPAENQNGSKITQPVNNFVFNQTNTSPKALNSHEIYRQTRNLLSQYRNK